MNIIRNKINKINSIQFNNNNDNNNNNININIINNI